MMATVLYGAGLRLRECLQGIAVEGYRFDTNPIVVRKGKGHKDRLTRRPAIVKAPLLSHFERVHTQYQQDLERGFGRVYLPDARRRRIPHHRARMGLAVGLPSVKGQPGYRGPVGSGGIMWTNRSCIELLKRSREGAAW